MGYRTATLTTYNCAINAWDGRVPGKVGGLSAQQAHIIERDNDFAADDKLGQVVQVAQRPVFQNPSPETHRRVQFPVDSFQFHTNGSAAHLALAGDRFG
jgi:hypothetical protein